MERTAGTIGQPLRADRFLLGILTGIGVLLVGALLAVLFLRQPVRDLPADTPGGTVQRFLQALERADYDGAYAYLGDTMTGKPTSAEFARFNADRQGSEGLAHRLRIADERISGETANVTVEVTSFSTGGPLFGSDQWTTAETFLLRREAGGWRITSLPPRYWPVMYPR